MFHSELYGPDLLLILEATGTADDDNGVKDTHDEILSNKPRRVAFSSFLQIIEIHEYIRKLPNNTKVNESVLQLSSDVVCGIKLLKKV